VGSYSEKDLTEVMMKNHKNYPNFHQFLKDNQILQIHFNNTKRRDIFLCEDCVYTTKSEEDYKIFSNHVMFSQKKCKGFNNRCHRNQTIEVINLALSFNDVKYILLTEDDLGLCSLSKITSSFDDMAGLGLRLISFGHGMAGLMLRRDLAEDFISISKVAKVWFDPQIDSIIERIFQEEYTISKHKWFSHEKSRTTMSHQIPGLSCDDYDFTAFLADISMCNIFFDVNVNDDCYFYQNICNPTCHNYMNDTKTFEQKKLLFSPLTRHSPPSTPLNTDINGFFPY